MSVTISGSGQIIKQVVQATYSTQVSTTSSSFVTTGVSASITPTNSANKILVLINDVLSVHQLSAANFGLGVAIYRNGSSVFTDPNNYDSLYLAPYGNYIGVDRKRLSIQYLDSPATTSSTTYTLYFAAYQGTAYSCANSAPATITLMEVAYA